MLLRILLLLVLASILLGCSEFDPVDLPGEYGWSWSREPDFTPRDIWSDGETIVVVGRLGRIRRFDGENWHEDDSGTTSHLSFLDGPSLDNLWAVGANGTILRFDGAVWHKENSPSSVNLYRIDVGSNGDVAAIGDEHRLIVRTRGVWSKYVVDTPLLDWFVFVDDDGSVWCSGADETLWVLQGTELTSMEYPSQHRIQISDMARHQDGSLYILGSSQLYILRDNEWSDPQWFWSASRFRMHADGSVEIYSRTRHSLISNGITEHSNFDLDDIWKVEVAGTQDFVAYCGQDSIMTGTNENWSLKGTMRQLHDIDEIVRLRDGRLLAGTSKGQLILFDGHSWVDLSGELKSPVIAASSHSIKDMVIDAHGDVYILNSSGYLIRWRETSEVLGDIGSWHDIIAIHPLGDGRVIAVGYEGKVILTNGRSAELIEPFTSNDLYDIWGTGPNDLYVSGRQEIWYWDGVVWELQVQNKRMWFYAIQGSPSGRIVATGWDGGEINVRQASGQWKQYTGSWDASLRHMTTTTNGAIYATGNDGGLMWIGNGEPHWIDPPEFNIDLNGIASDEDGAAYIGTSYGGIYRYGR